MKLDYKKIVDKIIQQTQIAGNEYTVEDRINDIMQAELFLLSKTKRIASKYPFKLPNEVTSETFSVNSGDNTLTRTIKNVYPHRVLWLRQSIDIGSATHSDWVCLERKTDCPDGCECYCFDNFKFEIDSDEIRLYNALEGSVKIEYQKGEFTHYTENQYNDFPVPDTSEPEWLDETYRPLLWMRPAMRYAGYFKPERRTQIQREYDELYNDFLDYLGQFTENIGWFRFKGENNHR